MGHFRSNSRSSPLRKTDVTLRSSQDCVFIANSEWGRVKGVQLVIANDTSSTVSTSALPPPSRSPFFSHEDNAGSASSSSFLHANTRGSLDLSPASTNDPFVDPSLRLSFSSTRETDDSSRRPSFASNRRPSEVNRDLASALSEELSPPKPRIDTSGARFQNGGARSAPPAPPSWGQVHNNKSPKEETSPSLMKQFRTGERARSLKVLLLGTDTKLPQEPDGSHPSSCPTRRSREKSEKRPSGFGSQN